MTQDDIKIIKRITRNAILECINLYINIDDPELSYALSDSFDLLDYAQELHARIKEASL